MNLGAYILPKTAGLLAGSSDAGLVRLRKAWPRWRVGRCDEGMIVAPIGEGKPSLSRSSYGPPEPCSDGLVWLPPLVDPTLYDLAREEIPSEVTVVNLRRVGPVNVPLGLGPVYGMGPKRGDPSSAYGMLAREVHAAATDKTLEWGPEEEASVELLLFLAFQFCYALTWETWCRIAPYDLDEVQEILGAIWGSHPKASSDGGASLPPSLPASSQTPNSAPPNGTASPPIG